MKQFRCGDVVPGCTAKFCFPTEEQILAAVAEHASKDHGLAEVPPALVAQVRTYITETAA